MHADPNQILELANDRIARDMRHAALLRAAHAARGRSRLSLRQGAARLLIQLGERLATEPILTPVRPR